MFALVRYGIFGEQRAGMGNSSGELRVNECIAEWRTPGAVAENCGFRSVGKMADAKNDDSFRKRDARKYACGHVPGVKVAGMRNQTSAAIDFFAGRLSLKEILNLLRKSPRIVWIELAGYGGSAKHGHSWDQLGFEGLPLTLRAFLVSGSKKTVTLSPY